MSERGRALFTVSYLCLRIAEFAKAWEILA